MSNTDHLALPFIDAAQAQKHVTHNAALNLLDCVVQLSISARNVLNPPGTPVEGQRLLLGIGATGAFTGHDGTIATFQDGAWGFLTPVAGWRAYSEAENLLLIYNGLIWADVMSTLKQAQNLSLLGLNTTATAQNPLSATLNSALFAALPVAASGTGDMRMMLNKATLGNTVSQLYQDNFSGRAETGLTGDDHFHVKVSPDGAIWHEAINIDNTTGEVTFPSGAALLPGFRNRLRNASLVINQRGVTGTVSLAAGAYGHDGVKAGAAGATYSFTQSGVDTTLTIAAGSLILPVEAGMIEGGNYVLSQAGTAQARVWPGTGTAGAGIYATCPLALSGQAANTQTNIEFSTGTVLQPQFEPGLVATAFERRPIALEMLLCQRYAQVLTSMMVFSSAVGAAFGHGDFNRPMRAAPMVSVLTPGQINFPTGGGSKAQAASDFAFTLDATSVGVSVVNTAASAANLPGIFSGGQILLAAEL